MPAANDEFTLAIIGGGSAGEALTRELADSHHRIVIFEPGLVGGECPFTACMPSKAMLHDAGVGLDWNAAVARRDEIVSHLDDTDHARTAERLGATIVRQRGEIDGPGAVRASDGTIFHVDQIVVATGSGPNVPPIDGLDIGHERVWQSSDALTTHERPESLVIIGGGVVGSELAFAFAGFDVSVTTLDSAERPAGDLHPHVSELIVGALRDRGVDVVNGVEIERVDLGEDDVSVHLADGAVHSADRLLVAVGRSPRHAGLGLERLGVDPDDVTIDSGGRLVSSGDHDVWFLGDAAGGDQYTHVANHHAAVVADRLVGTQSRRYDDAVVPACIFIDPPVMVVGPTWSELEGDDDIVWAELELDTPRSLTDDLGAGFLAVAARRSTGCIVAANGIGARFDEIVHALVIAIDGAVAVDRLARTIQPFPTVGEILTQAFADLASALSS